MFFQWKKIKNSVTSIIVKNNGTISHHHGVGVDHADWLEDEKGTLAYDVLKSMKKDIDPKSIFNPKKLYSN